MKTKRPSGLLALAVINFIYATWKVLYIAAMLLVISGVVEIDPDQFQDGYSVFDYIFPSVGASLLVISGVGFFRMNYRYGFFCGIVFAVSELVIFCLFNVFCLFDGAAQPVWHLIYPIVLLIVLLLKYRKAFRTQ